MCIRHRPSQPLVAVAAHVLTDPWRVPRCALCREKGSEEHDSWTFLWLMSVPHTCCHASYRPLVLDLTMCIWAMIGCRLCRLLEKTWVAPGTNLSMSQPFTCTSSKNFWCWPQGVPSRCLVRIGESLGVRRFCPQWFFPQMCYSQVQQYRKKSLRPNQDLADEPWPKPPKHGLTSLTTWGFCFFLSGIFADFLLCKIHVVLFRRICASNRCFRPHLFFGGIVPRWLPWHFS